MATRRMAWTLGLGLGLAAACAWGQGRADDWGTGVRWPNGGQSARETSKTAHPDFGIEEAGTTSWLSERLTLGLAVSRIRLSDNHRSPHRPDAWGTEGTTFLGALNLMELENETVVVPVATYWVARYLRAKATWEIMKTRVFNYKDDDPYGPHGQTDGLAKMNGPVAMLEAVWPLMDDKVFPHAGAGVFYGFGDFDEDTFWHLGYSSPESWELKGKPKKKAGGHYREIHMDDGLGWVASAGVAWRPARHFELDLEMRKTWVSADAEYGYITGDGWEAHHPGEFSFDNVTWSLSASWVF